VLVLGLSIACPSGEPETRERTGTAGAPAPAAPAPEAPVLLPAAADLMAAHVEAIGGHTAIDRIQTLYAESGVDTGAQNIRAAARTWWSRRGFYGEQEIPGFGVARSGYDGSTVWIEDPINGLRRLDGREAEQIIRQGAVFLIAEWKDHFESAETVEARQVDGATVYDVKLESPLGDQVVLGFAATDKLLSHMRFDQITPTGTIPVRASFEDYRDVGGVKFAYRSTLEIALGAITQTYTKIEVNAPVDETKFAFPAGREVVPAQPTEPGPVPPAAGSIAK
jgi:hypothetical protein